MSLLSKNIKKMLLVNLSIAFLIGCSSAPKEHYTETIRPEPRLSTEPCWVRDITCKDSEDKLAILGISKDFATEQEAALDSDLDAQRRAVETIEFRLRRIDDEVISKEGRTKGILSGGVAGDDATQKLVDQTVSGMRPVNYRVRFEVKEYGVGDMKWKSYSLILLPKNVAKAISEAVLNEKDSKDPIVQRAKERLQNLREGVWKLER